MILSFAPSGSVEAGLPLWLIIPTVAALLAYVVACAVKEGTGTVVRSALLAGWLAHAVSILFDTTGFGSGQAMARFGFAPALSVTLWLVLAVYLVESRFLPLVGARRALAVLGAVAVTLAWFFPGELRPQMSRWAPLHWVLGIASYGLFGAAVLHAVLLRRADRQMRQKATSLTQAGLPLLQLERLTFRFVAAGFVILTAALLLGWWFSDPWRWDHKSIFSIMGWAVLAALLVGRTVFGWRGVHATRCFVLEVLLPHASPG
jgi:ABC-type uncharacterized transport system permease subunit